MFAIRLTLAYNVLYLCIIRNDNPCHEGLVERTLKWRKTMNFFFDRKSQEIMNALKSAPIFKKQGHVNARPATAGEEITTTLKDGKKETVNKAGEGDWIVTNPSGEMYIISGKKFLGRYEATRKDGVYAAKGYCRAITNPFGRPIEIMASWGSPQTGDERCLIADTCDASGKVDGEPYLIDADAFAKTYKQVEG